MELKDEIFLAKEFSSLTFQLTLVVFMFETAFALSLSVWWVRAMKTKTEFESDSTDARQLKIQNMNCFHL